MKTISTSEWEVMRVVWTLKQATSKNIIDNLQKKKWKPATVKTLIGRLVNKKFLGEKTAKRPYIFYPLVDETKAMNRVSSDLFKHLCDMHKGQVLLNLLNETEIDQDDIKKMQSLLSKKIKTAPKMVDCNCVGGRNDG
ncbi:CopY/TcrY family copper transport repressor [Lactobacillus acetotolerans]|jgi:CopY/TcrY family copper transport repressor|uniref:Copper transport repressor n=1 Tax=Lactobacillus acetotolerans TaxID=1600 RepID=A0A0D6A2Z9_9LACO|nr:CopY/TcrY family copper transport repressor [Lactobacillus acetotolerans]KRN41701.1 hypothetical protein FC77_GL001437 [Lactobacillus acetotolerans DSM 20749 = JCM 3825]QFG51231.1 CopY/TcrY family copper transport repressor [Lactobacillus acetotolerans]QGV04660.1 CopY/TcrY family copper transport repressor [Lactobacillus acetotolerans]QJD73523.1 CopY/TcrY family copper transport repressor [Lactobacillus acetotolerans]BAQ57188.1 copper transport repressor [Lactobacillus acetotolerans]